MAHSREYTLPRRKGKAPTRKSLRVASDTQHESIKFISLITIVNLDAYVLPDIAGAFFGIVGSAIVAESMVTA
jgi:hypothetical protein